MPCITKNDCVPLDKPGTLIIIWDWQICRHTALICLATHEKQGSQLSTTLLQDCLLTGRETGSVEHNGDKKVRDRWMAMQDNTIEWSVKWNCLLSHFGQRTEREREKEQLKRQTEGDEGRDKKRKRHTSHCGLPLVCGPGLPGLPWWLDDHWWQFEHLIEVRLRLLWDRVNEGGGRGGKQEKSLSVSFSLSLQLLSPPL